MPISQQRRAQNLQAERNRLGIDQNKLDAVLGVQSLGPVRSLNLTSRDASGQVRQAGDIAGQTNPWDSVSQRDRDTVQRFFSPALDERGTQVVKDIATFAAGQGLMGGAVRTRVEEAGTIEMARARAETVGDTSRILSRFAGDATNRAGGFLASIGALKNTLGSALALYPSAGDNFEPFVQEALDAMSAVGLGGEAIAGLARARGVKVGGEGTQGHGADIYGQAFNEYLNPRDVGGYQSLARGTGAQKQRRRMSLELTGRADNRIAAGSLIADEVGGRVRNMQSAAEQLRSLGGAQLSAYQAGGGGIQAARKFLEADFSRFATSFSTPFGLSFLGKDVNPVSAGNRASGFLPQSALFTTAFGGR